VPAVDGFHFWGHSGDSSPLWKGCYNTLKAYQTISATTANLGKNREMLMIFKYPGGAFPDSREIGSAKLSLYKTWDGRTHSWNCPSFTNNYVVRLLASAQNFTNECDSKVEATAGRSYTVGGTQMAVSIGSSINRKVTIDLTTLVKEGISSGLAKNDELAFQIAGAHHGCLSAFASSEASVASERPVLDVKLATDAPTPAPTPEPTILEIYDAQTNSYTGESCWEVGDEEMTFKGSYHVTGHGYVHGDCTTYYCDKDGWCGRRSAGISNRRIEISAADLAANDGEITVTMNFDAFEADNSSNEWKTCTFTSGDDCRSQQRCTKTISSWQIRNSDSHGQGEFTCGTSPHYFYLKWRIL